MKDIIKKDILIPNYDVDYFIEKFTNIPEHHWTEKVFNRTLFEVEKCCALGHCGARHTWDDTSESRALHNLFKDHQMGVIDVNDGAELLFFDKTVDFMKSESPRGRILGALEYIKKQEQQYGL